MLVKTNLKKQSCEKAKTKQTDLDIITFFNFSCFFKFFLFLNFSLLLIFVSVTSKQRKNFQEKKLVPAQSKFYSFDNFFLSPIFLSNNNTNILNAKDGEVSKQLAEQERK